MMGEDQILEKVTLLAIYKKQPDESLDDILEILVDTGMYDHAEGREVFARLRKSGHIVGDALSLVGLNIAKRAEQEFKQ